MTEAWFKGAATMDPVLTRDLQKKQKDQENGQKENGNI